MEKRTHTKDKKRQRPKTDRPLPRYESPLNSFIVVIFAFVISLLVLFYFILFYCTRSQRLPPIVCCVGLWFWFGFFVLLQFCCGWRFLVFCGLFCSVFSFCVVLCCVVLCCDVFVLFSLSCCSPSHSLLEPVCEPTVWVYDCTG